MGGDRKETLVSKFNDLLRQSEFHSQIMLDKIDEISTLNSSGKEEQSQLVPLFTGAKLKPYQLKGVKWMIALWLNGLNGILADEMGLGKTVQTIGFLAHLIGNNLNGPFLIVAPLSTLSNWINEISRFTPSIHAVIYHGMKKKRKEIRHKYMPREVCAQFPLLVTSYETAMKDARILSYYSWKCVIVDEGHRLKNTQCKLVKKLRGLSIQHILMLTGTPVQNNLSELWSLLNFILPDIFSALDDFRSWFSLPENSCNNSLHEEFEDAQRAQVIANLHIILRPYILRRMKEDVELMLPLKKEIILYANMTEHQRKFQDLLIKKTLRSFLEEKGKNLVGRPGVIFKLSNLFIQLRKNCNHPDLLGSDFDCSYTYPPIEKLVGECGKFCLLDRLLTKLLSGKHKILIFSQWTKILDIIEYYLSEKLLKVLRIDGGVKLDERNEQIREFNDLESDFRIFLLSTRVGGLGLSLVAADTCILYDSDWNPQIDLQAISRCHRIGQTRPVHVYRLVTSLSVEGRIIKNAFGKLQLEHLVLGKGQFQQQASSAIEEEELLAWIQDGEDKLNQTDISDENLQRVLDRSDLIEEPRRATLVLPHKGPGWEVVNPVSC